MFRITYINRWFLKIHELWKTILITKIRNYYHITITSIATIIVVFSSLFLPYYSFYIIILSSLPVIEFYLVCIQI